MFKKLLKPLKKYDKTHIFIRYGLNNSDKIKSFFYSF